MNSQNILILFTYFLFFVCILSEIINMSDKILTAQHAKATLSIYLLLKHQHQNNSVVKLTTLLCTLFIKENNIACACITKMLIIHTLYKRLRLIFLCRRSPSSTFCIAYFSQRTFKTSRLLTKSFYTSVSIKMSRLYDCRSQNNKRTIITSHLNTY